MQYFEKSFLEFFQELEVNNNKDWFDRNRKRYENKVKIPFALFTKDVIAALQKEVDSEITVEPKHCIFRINRDIRFSPDKTPYKTTRSCFISLTGKKGYLPGFYFMFNANVAQIGCGAYGLPTAHLRAVRNEIVYNLDDFNSILKNKQLVKNFGPVQGSKNKVLPAEFKAEATKQPLLYNKQFYLWSEASSDTILQPDLITNMMTKYKAAVHFYQFLKTALVEVE